jgi:hypothetical protein
METVSQGPQPLVSKSSATLTSTPFRRDWWEATKWTSSRPPTRADSYLPPAIVAARRILRTKRPYKRVKLFGSCKLSRLILDALRKVERPMTTPEVIAAVVAELGYGAEAPAGMKGRVRGALLYLRLLSRKASAESGREKNTGLN